MKKDDGRPRLEPDPESLVAMSQILDPFVTCGASNRILLADCCRDDPNRARGRNPFGTTLRVDDLPSGTVALFACSASEQAFEHDDWGHGAFTYAFLEHAQSLAQSGSVTSGMLKDKMYDTVSKIVKDKTKGQSSQTLYSLSAGGRVDLLLKGVLSKSITNKIGMKFQLIPRGRFLMGSPADEEGRKDDEFQHAVEISQDYYLGTCEVTQGQWKRVMGTEPWIGEKLVKNGDSYPAVYVSWDDAVSFCEKLSRLDGAKYRLPTEAEWERACRGGSRAAYSFGADTSKLDDYAWFDGNAADKDEKYAHSIGRKKPNAYGLYDIHGNVWEWCSDWYNEGYFQSSPLRDPQGPKQDSLRVGRGGSWSYDLQVCRSAFRCKVSPDAQYSFVGFRVLRSSIK